MTLDDKVRKTLAELGVSDAAGVEALFAEVKWAMESERQALIARGAPSEHERDRLAKELRDRWLARKNGLLSSIDENWLKIASKELKPAVGREFNQLRQAADGVKADALTRAVPLAPIEVSIAGRELPDKAAFTVVVQGSIADLTLPGVRRSLGSVHLVTQVMREIEDIFLGLGFSIETGPEIETTYYNFDALNIPETHPARDDWDTLYVRSQESQVRSQEEERSHPPTPETRNPKPDLLLRTHTSPVQIHAMEKRGAPLYIICPGKCYRHDNPDSSHATMFHQVEGLAVDTDITFADLKGTLDYFAKKFFGEKIRTNFFPSFFPFTEPSGDVAISCTICDGKGCRVCKESGWLEVMGCGMVHPDVLEHGGIDPKKYSGWAFGLGVERFAMMKYGINDIQLFFQSDVRFLEQF